MPEETKLRSAMFVGPFGHGTSVSKKAEYLLANGNLPADYIAEWFDSIRENRAYAYAERGKVTYYSIGDDQWRSDVYPKETGRAKRFWLGANGRLLPSDTVGERRSYLYDPSALTGCYRSGNIFRAHAAGTVSGVLSFFSDPFEQEERFFGKVRFHLNVSSDCEDTAFFMRVYFVDGEESYNLTETVGALSYFTDRYTPNEEIAIELDTPPIAFTVFATEEKEGSSV
jgi:predicted acyl esterase